VTHHTSASEVIILVLLYVSISTQNLKCLTLPIPRPVRVTLGLIVSWYAEYDMPCYQAEFWVFDHLISIKQNGRQSAVTNFYPKCTSNFTESLFPEIPLRNICSM